MTNLLRKQYPFEVKTQPSNEEGDVIQGLVIGYASTWAKDAFGDRVDPGAFAQSITDKRGKYPLLFGHDTGVVIGFTNRISEDHKGLLMEAQLAMGTTAGRDAFALVQAAQAADYRMGLSIGFVPHVWEMEQDVRVLKEIDLWEISLTPFPANKFARVAEARAMPRSTRNEDQLRHAIRSMRLRLGSGAIR